MQSLTVCRRGQFKDSISSLNSSSITITSPIIMNFYYTLFLTFFAHLSCSEASEKFENSLELKQTNVTTTNTNTSTVITARPRPCSCGGGVCSCCVQLFSNLWRQKTCVNVTYDADEFSFTTKVSMNDRVLYTRTVSGKNPRPICVPVPRLPILRACVRLYNIYFQGRNMHACVSMEGKFNDSTVFKVGLDCIRLGTNGVALVTPEDGGGLGQIEFFPASESDEEDDYDDEDDDDDDDDDYY